MCNFTQLPPNCLGPYLFMRKERIFISLIWECESSWQLVPVQPGKMCSGGRGPLPRSVTEVALGLLMCAVWCSGDKDLSVWFPCPGLAFDGADPHSICTPMASCSCLASSMEQLRSGLWARPPACQARFRNSPAMQLVALGDSINLSVSPSLHFLTWWESFCAIKLSWELNL